ncbi:signal peptidase complex catalytic subunit SEC11C-like isoform X2 [Chenopodium quinoa]|uniref:signal peptidase complex catalytic subunit SEC11C-like isoform X2 n=1 Tax=Chenopodium quinoa TaxID=63459 RepID=UPI000B7944B1|nr:signal peptidase complex catalytic subunit SEC11C-like isoform X2 [Chenopodium quinoa]
MLDYVKLSHRSIPSRGLLVTSVLMTWQLLILVTGTKYPVSVVLSGSMEPGIRKGDLLFLSTIKSHPIQTGEILLFKIEGKEIPIVHRVIKVQRQKASNKFILLTKGDANSVDDRYGGIYADGQLWLEDDDITGRVIGIMPYFGWPSILIQNMPLMKFVLIGGLIGWNMLS